MRPRILIAILFLVTDRRILSVDKQGLTGAKKNYDSIAFNKVGRFSVEFGGGLTGMVTVRIWASGAGVPGGRRLSRLFFGGVLHRQKECTGRRPVRTCGTYYLISTTCTCSGLTEGIDS